MDDFWGKVVPAVCVLFVVADAEETHVGGVGCVLISLCGVEAHLHSHLHIGLTRAEPDVSKEDIIEDHSSVVLLRGDCERVGLLVGFMRGEKDSPTSIFFDGSWKGILFQVDNDLVVEIRLSVNGSMIGSSLLCADGDGDECVHTCSIIWLPIAGLTVNSAKTQASIKTRQMAFMYLGLRTKEIRMNTQINVEHDRF